MGVQRILSVWVWFLFNGANSFLVPKSPTRGDIVLAMNSAKNNNNNNKPDTTNTLASNLLATSIAIAAATATGFSPTTVQAYDPSDYASDTVQETVQALKKSTGDIEATFKTYESIASIVTEGKGVGGMINYQGVALERGYVADEDTSIYNPGLTLLTESEKERLVEAIVNSRQGGLKQGQWNENNQFAYEFLKEKLDPFHMYELTGYMGIVPIYGAILYLGVLAVQQIARDLFPAAYIAGVIAFFGPIVALVVFSNS